MILSDISVKRPVLAIVISLILIAFGTLSFLRLPLRELPDIDPPVVSINTTYVGAPAGVVETRVTKVLEDAINGIEGIETIESTSEDGRSSITIEFDLNRDIESAANDVRDAVARAVGRLPEDIDPPTIAKVDADSDVIVWYNFVTNKPQLEIGDFADRYIVDRLSVVDGVAQVRIGGAARYAMRIWIDRARLAAHQLTIGDVEQALRAENVELPGGSLESKSRDLSIRVTRSYKTPQDFAALPLRKGADGYIIRLGDVAKIERGGDIDHIYFRGNGVPMVNIGIVKQSKANTLEVVRKVEEEVKTISKTLPEGMHLVASYDSSLFIAAAIHEVYLTLGLAMGLVIFVIYLFLGNLRSAIIPAVTVPVCIIGSFTALAAFGLSINLLTLLALVLAIGLVVDDAIIVLENIQRRIDLGEPPLVAAFRGARQVGFAVLATTAVLIAVFTPIMFLQGNIGRLFTELAIAIASAVAFSALVALTLTPAMCATILQPSASRRGLTLRVESLFARVRNGYKDALTLCLAHPRPVAGVVALCLLGAGLLWSFTPSELAPREDRGIIFINVNGPEGANYDYTVRQMRQLEEILEPDIKNGTIWRALTRVPGSFGNTTDMSTGRAIVSLAPWDERRESDQEFLKRLRPKFMTIAGAKVIATTPQPIGRGFGAPVQFVIGGTDYRELVTWRDILLKEARANPNLYDVDSDYKETKPQLQVSIDRTRASDLGVSVGVIGHTLETMLGSRKVTTYLDRGEEYDVVLRVQPDDRRQLEDLTNIYVRSERTGAMVPLSNLVTVSEVGEASTLRRFNRLRAVTISANLAPGYTLGQALDFLEKTAREKLPAVAQVDYRGQSRTFKQSSSALYFTFGLALIVVFLVLAGQFESFVHPCVILMSVPLAVVGGLLGLFITGSTLNIYSQIGIIILIGLAAKNGILIVEFANQLRDQGRSFEKALIEAATIRLRPIVMTSVATAIGALPLVVASGPGASSRFTIGIVIFAGVLLATLLTVFVVPVFYKLIAQGTGSPQRVARRLAALEAKLESSPTPGE